MKGEIKRSHDGGVYCSGEGTVDADATKLLESMRVLNMSFPYRENY